MKLLEKLGHRIGETRIAVTGLGIWKAVESEGSPLDLKRSCLRELFWDVATYQWFTTRAGFKMIGSLPAAEHQLMQTLLMHKWEEVEHRVWAYDCYKSLGGTKAFPDSRDNQLTTSGASIAACWEWMADHLDPFAYVGAEYLFEKLTAVLSEEITPLLSAAGIKNAEMRFIADHVEEDAKHALLFDGLINRIELQKPEKVECVLQGYDCFEQVYPCPAWDAVYQRALESCNESTAAV